MISHGPGVNISFIPFPSPFLSLAKTWPWPDLRLDQSIFLVHLHETNIAFIRGDVAIRRIVLKPKAAYHGRITVQYFLQITITIPGMSTPALYCRRKCPIPISPVWSCVERGNKRYDNEPIQGDVSQWPYIVFQSFDNGLFVCHGSVEVCWGWGLEGCAVGAVDSCVGDDAHYIALNVAVSFAIAILFGSFRGAVYDF